MTHGDDAGVVVPPRLAPIQVVIVPIFRKEEEQATVVGKAEELAAALRAVGVRTHIDARENMSPGAKFYEWERKGVPLRAEIGPKDIEKQQLVLVLRKEVGGLARKEMLPEAGAAQAIRDRLDRFQTALFADAVARREANSHRGVTDYKRMREIVEGDGGLVYAGWCGNAACEQKVKEETKATIRCLPLEEFRSPEAPATCLVCGAVAQAEAIWARAY